MKFRVKRHCRLRLLLVALLLFILSSFFFHKYFVYSPSSLPFIELHSCPACFGVRLCHLFGTHHVRLSGFISTSSYHSNTTNIHSSSRLAISHPHSQHFYLVQTTHSSPPFNVRECDHHLSSSSSSSSKQTSISSSHRFILSTDLDVHDSQRALQTTIQINLEPIVLSV